MIQRNIGIKKEQWERLKSISLETGAPISALIRKAIDGFLKDESGEVKNLPRVIWTGRSLSIKRSWIFAGASIKSLKFACAIET